MSLNWNLSNVKNRDQLCFDTAGNMEAVTQFLIFNTMAIDMGSITDENYIEFWQRCEVVDRLRSIYLHDRDGNSVITLDVVKAHIGLSVNVATVPAGKWFERISKLTIREIKRIEEAA